MIENRTYWLKYSRIKYGKQRMLVLMEFDAHLPVTCEQLRKRINDKIKDFAFDRTKLLSLREISRQMKFFKKEKLVICLDKNAPYHVPYMLTELGKKIKEQLSKET